MLEQILERIERGFSDLFAEDAELFRKGLHEQTVTFRLGLHLQRHFHDLGYTVDCEYNRQWDDPKRREDTGRLIKPDLVVHRRLQPGASNVNANLLVLEAKKSGCWRRTFRGLDRRLCEMTRGGRFAYKLGVCWKLCAASNAAEQPVTWFRNGRELTKTSLLNFSAQVLRALNHAQNA
jgi:hypothetical protein